RGDDGDFGIELHLHQRSDHGIRDEFVAIDATVHDEACRYDRRIAGGLRQQLCQQRDLEGAWYLEEVDKVIRDAEPRDLRHEAIETTVNDVFGPPRLHEGDAIALCLAFSCARDLSIALIHGGSFWSGPESGRTG